MLAVPVCYEDKGGNWEDTPFFARSEPASSFGRGSGRGASVISAFRRWAVPCAWPGSGGRLPPHCHLRKSKDPERQARHPEALAPNWQGWMPMPRSYQLTL